MRKRYPSDISQEQFKEIEPMLLVARKITRPRKYELYDIFCAVLYLLKSGCQWRMIPSDFPDWQNVYAYFRIWSYREENNPSLLEQILKKISWRGPSQQWSEYEDKLRNH
jgi:transposase